MLTPVRQLLPVVSLAVALAGCGGSGSAPTAPAPPPPAPPSGGVIQTGVSSNGTTTAFRLTISVASAADRQANVQVFIDGPQNGVCLENVAPDERPSGTDVDLKAGVPVTITIDTWRVTSVCFYPNHVTGLTARMMPSPDIFGTPIFEKRFAVDYTVTR
jgi:hypothetical protein